MSCILREMGLQLIYSASSNYFWYKIALVLVWFHLYIESKTHEFYSPYIFISSILFLCQNIKEILTFSKTKYYLNNL